MAIGKNPMHASTLLNVDFLRHADATDGQHPDPLDAGHIMGTLNCSGYPRQHVALEIVIGCMP